MKHWYRGRPCSLSTPAWVLALIFCVSIQPLLAAGFSSVERLVVFGDQLSDVGRVGGVAEVDNVLWVQQLAAQLFIETPEPYNASTQPVGLNFAQVGATSVGENPFDNGQEQLDLYLNDILAGAQIPQNSLIVVWFGLNDLLQNQEAATVVDGIASMLTRLADAGAERIILPTMLPIGRTPDKNSDVTTWNAVATNFNTAMALRLSVFRGSYPLVEVVTVDTFGLFEDIVSDPDAYGMVDVTGASSFSAADPGSSLWWSLISPTSLAHSYLADLAYEELLAVLPGDASNVSVELLINETGSLSVEVNGPAIEILRLERSANMVRWTTIATYVDFDGSEIEPVIAPSGVPLYFRAR